MDVYIKGEEAKRADERRAGIAGALSRIARKAERARSPRARFWHKRNVDKKRGQWQTSRLCCSAQAALNTASETLPSAEERRVEAAAAESLAASGAGDVAKTAIGVARRLRRQWLRWLTEHGEAYEYDATVGGRPWSTCCTSRRTASRRARTTARSSWTALAIHGASWRCRTCWRSSSSWSSSTPGWVGLKADELAAKCKPYALEARAHWKRLKVSHVSGAAL
eukprot:scaffold32802_cov61-Phaeocystis_antarctica.AAC.5